MTAPTVTLEDLVAASRLSPSRISLGLQTEDILGKAVTSVLEFLSDMYFYADHDPISINSYDALGSRTPFSKFKTSLLMNDYEMVRWMLRDPLLEDDLKTSFTHGSLNYVDGEFSGEAWDIFAKTEFGQLFVQWYDDFSAERTKYRRRRTESGLDAYQKLSNHQLVGATAGVSLGAAGDTFAPPDNAVLRALVKTAAGSGDSVGGLANATKNKLSRRQGTGDADTFATANAIGLATGPLSDAFLAEGSAANELAYLSAGNLLGVLGVVARRIQKEGVRQGLRSAMRDPFLVGNISGIGIVAVANYALIGLGVDPDTYSEEALRSTIGNLDTIGARISLELYDRHIARELRTMTREPLASRYCDRSSLSEMRLEGEDAMRYLACLREQADETDANVARLFIQKTPEASSITFRPHTGGVELAIDYAPSGAQMLQVYKQTWVRATPIFQGFEWSPTGVLVPEDRREALQQKLGDAYCFRPMTPAKIDVSYTQTLQTLRSLDAK